MLDNIVRFKLYRPGSDAYVSKSGGMSNELNNIICRNFDGVDEGVAIGGNRYPGSSFIDHLLRYNDNPGVHILVLTFPRPRFFTCPPTRLPIGFPGGGGYVAGETGVFSGFSIQNKPVLSIRIRNSKSIWYSASETY